MNAVPKETAKEAARRLSAQVVSKGYKPTALYEYQNADGTPWCWRMRCDGPNGAKWIRPMRFNGAEFEASEPEAPPEGKPLYRLPAMLANPEALVWIVEGEKCADALATLGLVSTTSGSSASADSTNWKPLAGRRAALWPDNDPAGAKYAQAVQTRLAAIGCALEVVEVEALGLPVKGDAADWLASRPQATASDIDALPRVGSDPDAPGLVRSAPEALQRPVPEASPYPVDALGPVLGPAAECIQAATEAPPAICALSVLATASLAAQAHANVLNRGRVEPLSLWIVSVAASGERKSTVDALANRPVKELERAGADAYTQALREHDAETAAHKAAARKADSSKAPEAVKEAHLKLGPLPEPPLAPWILVSEPTLEGLHRLLADGRPSVGLFSSDAGEFLGGHAMSRDNKTKTAAGLSLLWDDGEFSRIRSGDGAKKYYGRRVAMHLMLQPVLAEELLSDPVLVGQGFLPRCLLAWPKSTIGTRMGEGFGADGHPALLRYHAVIDGMLRTAPALRLGTRNELEPRGLVLSPEAQELWQSIAKSTELDMRPSGDYAGITAWASKGASQALRVAGVLAMADDMRTGVIEVSHIRNAARLVEWHLREAARIFGLASVSPETRRAQSLLDWLHETGRTHLYSADALKWGPRGIRERDTLLSAARMLEGAGCIDPLPAGALVDGAKRQKAWLVRPKGA